MSAPETGVISWMAPEADDLVRPAGFGRGRRTNSIAIVYTVLSQGLPVPERIPQWGPEEELDPWSRSAISAAATAAEMAGFNVLWYYWRRHESHEDLAERVFPALADGAIVLAPREEHLPLVSLLAAREIPCVVAYARHPDPRVAWVVCDNEGGMREAVQHVVGLGHRRIGFMAGPPSVVDLEERKQAFLAAMEDAGLAVDSALIRETGHRRGPEDVKPLATQLLRSSERPTAVLCATDDMALAVIQAAWDLGLQVPEDVAVVGFDDAEQAVPVSPRLTTVRQPIREIASRAMYLAACAVVGQEPETATWHIIYPAPLVVRESCGAAEEMVTLSGGSLSMAQQQRVRRLEAENEELRGLLYIGSHDLRSPLVTIKGFARRLDQKSRRMLDEQGVDSLDRIRRSVESMEELMEGLLGLSRAYNQPLNLQQTSVQLVLETALADLAELIQTKGARITVAPDLPVVTADEIALRQVFMNLIANALKYAGHPAPGGPEIEIGFRASRGAQLRCPPGAAEYEFYVRDNGVGVPEEMQERIFQPFQRGPDTEGAEGAGIGLSTVKGIILRHGGRVWVESGAGKGATFRFTLPRREGPAGS